MAARRYWFVLALFGVLLTLSLPLYRGPGVSCRRLVVGDCDGAVRSPGGVLAAGDLARPGWLAVYWAVALLFAVWLIARRYRRVGSPRRALPALFVMLLVGGAAAVLALMHWPGLRSSSALAASAQLLVFNGATPLLVSAVALLLLGAAERSWWLLLFAVGYAALAYGMATHDSFHLLDLAGLPVDLLDEAWGIRQAVNLAIPAALLLAAAMVAALAGRLANRRQGRRHARGPAPAARRKHS